MIFFERILGELSFLGVCSSLNCIEDATHFRCFSLSFIELLDRITYFPTSSLWDSAHDDTCPELVGRFDLDACEEYDS